MVQAVRDRYNKKDLSSTKRELLERIRKLEAENADLRNELKAALERC